jgi:hypothetical protein
MRGAYESVDQASGQAKKNGRFIPFSIVQAQIAGSPKIPVGAAEGCEVGTTFSDLKKTTGPRSIAAFSSSR